MSAVPGLSQPPFTGLRERWLNLRNRLIADQRFQRWAAASPFTRFVARRKTRALFDLCTGFVYSQVLFACVQLRLFDILRSGPRSARDLSLQLDLSMDSAQRLLRAAASLRLIRALPDERYGLDDLGASMLGNPSIAAFVEHHSLLYDDLRDPVALLRGEAITKLSQFWPYAADTGQAAVHSAIADDAQAFANYSKLMSATQALVAQDILDSYSMTRHTCLLDVGGGEGTFLAAAAQRAPVLALKLFDLPAVAARARLQAELRGLGAHLETYGGDFLRDPLPGGADVISLVRVLHDHDDASVLALLRAAHAALPKGGTLLIAEPMAGTRGGEAMGDAYFGFYLLAMGRGRARTDVELGAMLRTAGFKDIQELRTRRPLLVRVITARV